MLVDMVVDVAEDLLQVSGNLADVGLLTQGAIRVDAQLGLGWTRGRSRLFGTRNRSQQQTDQAERSKSESHVVSNLLVLEWALTTVSSQVRQRWWTCKSDGAGKARSAGGSTT